MITFTQITGEVQSSIGNTSSSELTIIKRDANRATQKFKSVMRRPWSRISRKADTVASQSDYSLPKSVLRVSGVSYKKGDSYVPLVEVSSEEMWNRLISMPSITINAPGMFFPKGKNVICVHPTPGEAVVEGLKIYYEPRQTDMEADDYTIGTVTVTEGDTTVTHDSAGFTPGMVGRYFHVTDGTHGYWYQIVTYTDASNVELENFYEGPSGSGKTFLIGVVPDIPDEYHDSIMDYCIARHHIRRGDLVKGVSLMKLYDKAYDECKELYSSPTSNDNISNLQGLRINSFDSSPSVLS